MWPCYCLLVAQIWQSAMDHLIITHSMWATSRCLVWARHVPEQLCYLGCVLDFYCHTNEQTQQDSAATWQQNFDPTLLVHYHGSTLSSRSTQVNITLVVRPLLVDVALINLCVYECAALHSALCDLLGAPHDSSLQCNPFGLPLSWLLQCGCHLYPGKEIFQSQQAMK